MPHYSATSQKKLASSHPALQRVFNEVIKHFDCSIICGRRDRAAQTLAFETGKSKAQYGQSPHNFAPAYAVDAVPYPIDWQDTERMIHFAGFVIATGKALGIDITWGGDWNRDTHLSDNRFDDFPHFELAGWRELSRTEGGL